LANVIPIESKGNALFDSIAVGVILW